MGEMEEDDYVEQFKPFMMDIVAAWCRGASFGDICKMTDLFEEVLSVVCGGWRNCYVRWSKLPKVLATQSWKTNLAKASSSSKEILSLLPVCIFRALENIVIFIFLKKNTFEIFRPVSREPDRQ